MLFCFVVLILLVCRRLVSFIWIMVQFWSFLLPQQHVQYTRTIYYGNTNAILLCFDVADRISFERISSVYIPEIRQHCPGVPIILVACKSGMLKGGKHTLIARFMGPIWGRQDPGGPHVGPMNFAIWVG